MVGLSSLPDLDIKWEIRHRGKTHTFLAGILFGIAFGIVIWYAYGIVGFLMGFLSGFGGVASHLLGDAFNYRKFKPFLPFSGMEVGFGIFESSNKAVNSTMFALGAVVFIVSYQPSVVLQIISIIRGVFL